MVEKDELYKNKLTEDFKVGVYSTKEKGERKIPKYQEMSKVELKEKKKLKKSKKKKLTEFEKKFAKARKEGKDEFEYAKPKKGWKAKIQRIIPGGKTGREDPKRYTTETKEKTKNNPTVYKTMKYSK